MNVGSRDKQFSQYPPMINHSKNRIVFSTEVDWRHWGTRRPDGGEAASSTIHRPRHYGLHQDERHTLDELALPLFLLYHSIRLEEKKGNKEEREEKKPDESRCHVIAASSKNEYNCCLRALNPRGRRRKNVLCTLGKKMGLADIWASLVSHCERGLFGAFSWANMFELEWGPINDGWGRFSRFERPDLKEGAAPVLNPRFPTLDTKVSRLSYILFLPLLLLLLLLRKETVSLFLHSSRSIVLDGEPTSLTAPFNRLEESGSGRRWDKVLLRRIIEFLLLLPGPIQPIRYADMYTFIQPPSSSCMERVDISPEVDSSWAIRGLWRWHNDLCLKKKKKERGRKNSKN